MKKRLIIISDLWGKEKAKWLIDYTSLLDKHFHIKFYDSCDLAGIDKSDYKEDSLHKQFVTGGIEKAVDNLIHHEQNSVNILAFSIGGTVAWKFGIRGGIIKNLYCISSTRLRKESEKPKCDISLYFGGNDDYKPNKEWFNNMKINPKILPNKDHSFYTEPDFAMRLSKQIIENL